MLARHIVRPNLACAPIGFDPRAGLLLHQALAADRESTRRRRPPGCSTIEPRAEGLEARFHGLIKQGVMFDLQALLVDCPVMPGIESSSSQSRDGAGRIESISEAGTGFET